MTRLMTFLSENAIEFSVTSNLMSLVDPPPILSLEEPDFAPEDPVEEVSAAETSMENVFVKQEIIEEEEDQGQIEKVLIRVGSSSENFAVNEEMPDLEYGGEVERVVIRVGSSNEDVVMKQETVEEEEEELKLQSTSAGSVNLPLPQTTSGNALPRRRKRSLWEEKRLRHPREKSTASSGASTNLTRNNLGPSVCFANFCQQLQQSSRFQKLRCQLCKCVVDHAPLRCIAHITAHLEMKLWSCQSCDGMFSRPEEAWQHHRDGHGTSKYDPFVPIVTEKQKAQVTGMMNYCFPELKLGSS